MTDPAPEVIRLAQVSLTYVGPPRVIALRPADLVVRSGEYLTVVGPSGSGKSTFLNVVGLLDRPTAGTYYLDRVDTGGLNETERTTLRGDRLGFVFQAYHLLPQHTAEENVGLALLYRGMRPALRRRLARDMLHRVGLDHRAGSPAAHLSGGEKQRVAIARALVHSPSVVLCDEPTGNLDSANARSVLDLLDELHADGYTLVVITHDADVARRGGRTIRISDGVLAPAAAETGSGRTP